MGGWGNVTGVVTIIVVTQSNLSERFCLVDIYLFFQSFASLIVSLHLQAKCWAAGPPRRCGQCRLMSELSHKSSRG